MSSKPAPPPVITVGEPVRETWCNTCQEPWRLRIPLLLDGEPAATLEMCPGCGQGHAQTGVYVTPPQTPGATPAPAPGPPLLPRYAAKIHGWLCARSGRVSHGCAYGDCPWPGLYRHELAIDGDEGTWRYYYCRKAHRRLWAAANDLILSLTTVSISM